MSRTQSTRPRLQLAALGGRLEHWRALAEENPEDPILRGNVAGIRKSIAWWNEKLADILEREEQRTRAHKR